MGRIGTQSEGVKEGSDRRIDEEIRNGFLGNGDKVFQTRDDE